MDTVQLKAGDIDEPLGTNDVFLHQVDKVGAPGDEMRACVSQAHRFAD